MRPMMEYIKNTEKTDMIGGEIGAWEGEHSQDILINLGDRIKSFYVIDPYEEYTCRVGKHYTQERVDKSYSIMLHRLRKFGKGKLKVIRKRSVDAILDITEDFDFIYIDGDHTYENVVKDLNLYWDKTKLGGIFGGDDYHNDTHLGVTKAIDEFVEDKNLILNVGLDRDKKIYDWWIVK